MLLPFDADTYALLRDRTIDVYGCDDASHFIRTVTPFLSMIYTHKWFMSAAPPPHFKFDSL